MAKPSWLTTDEVAAALGITRSRVYALIRSGRLKAEKLGRDWFVREKALVAVRDRKTGRPRKKP